jgi:hypothetical protein
MWYSNKFSGDGIDMMVLHRSSHLVTACDSTRRSADLQAQSDDMHDMQVSIQPAGKIECCKPFPMPDNRLPKKMAALFFTSESS